MTKEEVITLLCEHFSEGMVRTIIDALKQEQEYEVLAGIGKGVEIPAGWKYYYIKPKLPLQQKQEQGEPKCKTHPDAPHGFVRNASHSEDRYVCECEFWEPPEQGEPVGEVSDHDWSTGLLYRDLKPGTKLYTTPQTKKWVGLTKEDMSEFASKTPHWEELCYLVEAKLKEKTHE